MVVDRNFNRIKVKTPQYVALHRLRDGMGPKALVALAQANEGDEFLSYFPEYTAKYNEIKEKLDSLILASEIFYEHNENIKSQKEFALKVKDTPFGPACFALRAGKTSSMDEYYRTMKPDKLLKQL